MRWLALTALAGYCIDQASRALVRALGLPAAQNPHGELLWVAATCALIMPALYVRAVRRPTRLGLFACGLLIGGVGGNLTDYALHGRVVDFIHLAGFAFNLGDLQLIAGLLLLAAAIQPRRTPRR